MNLAYADFFQITEDYIPEPRILVVEDDESYRPIWEEILNQAAVQPHIDWAETEEAAERLIRNNFLRGHKYDLVIADVFLGGRRTGLDLWQRYGINSNEFVLVSGHDPEQIAELCPNEAFPYFCAKPLDISKSVQLVENLLHFKEDDR